MTLDLINRLTHALDLLVRQVEENMRPKTPQACVLIDAAHEALAEAEKLPKLRKGDVEALDSFFRASRRRKNADRMKGQRALHFLKVHAGNYRYEDEPEPTAEDLKELEGTEL